jgi:hypothetical protein
MSLTTHIRETALAVLAETGRCTVDDVAERAELDHGELIGHEARDLIHKQIKRIVKDILNSLADDEDEPADQPALYGLKLPSAIAIRRTDDSYYYVRTHNAVWPEIEAGLDEREDNIVRATVKRDLYVQGMDRLRPWMAGDPSVTVAEALRREADATTSGGAS